MRKFDPFIRLCAGVIVIAIVLFASTPAVAQSFLESLFGAFAPKPQRQQQIVPRQQRVPDGAGAVRANPFDNGRRKQSSAGGGRYKTMCVRLCDGFYFPISNGVPRRNFYRDAEACQSQCDSETRLFFMSKKAGSIDEARDQSGLNYKELPNAFVYRKKLDQSCTCRAKPWSTAERARHQRYAMIEAGELDPKTAAAELDGDAETGDKDAAERDEDLTKEPKAAQIAPGVARSQRQTAEARAVVRRARAARRPVPKKAMAKPAFGLGALFSGGGAPKSTKLKQYKKKLHWPGGDDN